MAATDEAASHSVRAEEARHALQVAGVRYRYGASEVLKGVSVDADSGEFLTLLGPSGSGKTTLLRCIGGLLVPPAGRIILQGRDITRLATERRNIGFVFQNYALFPHMTVVENVGYALKVRKVGRDEIAQRVRDVLALVGLQGLERRYPAQLSGGQQQRVALARAIVFEPSLLLLDEPLGALDRQLRSQLGLELRALQRRTGMTMIYVTHDQEEAFTLSTKVAVMNHGEILQVGSPCEIYHRPKDFFVARFVGELNTFQGKVAACAASDVTIDIGEGFVLRASSAEGLQPAERVDVGLRPEDVQVSAASTDGAGLRARVRTLIFGGSWHRFELALPHGGQIVAAGSGDIGQIREGEEVAVTYSPSRVLVFRSTAS